MKLKNLKSSSCSLSSISAEHLIHSQAIVRLENVDLQTDPPLNLAQLQVIFLEIRNSRELGLKTLLLYESSIYKMKKNYPDLFYKVSSMVKIIDTRWRCKNIRNKQFEFLFKWVLTSWLFSWIQLEFNESSAMTVSWFLLVSAMFPDTGRVSDLMRSLAVRTEEP